MPNLSLRASSQQEYIMECSVFLILQMEETWIKKYVKNETSQPFLQLEVPGIEDLSGLPIVLNQNKLSFLGPLFFFKLIEAILQVHLYPPRSSVLLG